MRVGLISDIHGNRVALDAVLDDMPAVDELICLGDIVGYGPRPSECIDIVRDHADGVVLGNHDLSLINDDYQKYEEANEMAYEGLVHAADRITDEQREWLAMHPEMKVFADGAVLAVHSHPDPDIRWTRQGYVSRREFTQLASYLGGASALVFGHTHDQHAVNMEKFESYGVVMNPGSVGQPRDDDPRAAYGVIELTPREDADSSERDYRMEATEHRVEYDIESVQTQIGAEGLPAESGERLANGD